MILRLLVFSMTLRFGKGGIHYLRKKLAGEESKSSEKLKNILSCSKPMKYQKFYLSRIHQISIKRKQIFHLDEEVTEMRDILMNSICPSILWEDLARIHGKLIFLFTWLPRRFYVFFQNSYAYVHAGFKSHVGHQNLVFQHKPIISIGGMGLKHV